MIPNKEADTNQQNEQLSTPEDHSHRNVRVESFVANYGIEEEHATRFAHIKHHLKKQYETVTFLCFLNALLDKIPLLRCLKEYNIRKNLFGDIISGITVAIMHIPQGRKDIFVEILFYLK
jgi:hypothetical protein